MQLHTATMSKITMKYNIRVIIQLKKQQIIESITKYTYYKVIYNRCSGDRGSRILFLSETLALIVIVFRIVKQSFE